MPSYGWMPRMWMDTIKPLSDGDAVSTWTDLSGSGHHATAALGVPTPLYKSHPDFNNKDVLSFPNTDYNLPEGPGFEISNMFSSGDPSQISGCHGCTNQFQINSNRSNGLWAFGDGGRVLDEPLWR